MGKSLLLSIDGRIIRYAVNEVNTLPTYVTIAVLNFYQYK
jgi:hypothetical protein